MVYWLLIVPFKMMWMDVKVNVLKKVYALGFSFIAYLILVSIIVEHFMMDVKLQQLIRMTGFLIVLFAIVLTKFILIFHQKLLMEQPNNYVNNIVHLILDVNGTCST